MPDPEKKKDESFFKQFGSLCEKMVVPQAKEAWNELKKGARDCKNVFAERQAAVKPRVREMKTKLTDSWKRGEKAVTEEVKEKVSHAAETSEEWAKRSMEEIDHKVEEVKPHVKSAIEEGKETAKELGSKLKEKIKRKKD